MLQLPCPWCGLRDESEFLAGGERRVRPDPAPASDTTWTDYLYFSDNPRGWIREHWVHAHGCGQWFVAVRHTVSNVVAAVRAVGDPLPELPE